MLNKSKQELENDFDKEAEIEALKNMAEAEYYDEMLARSEYEDQKNCEMQMEYENNQYIPEDDPNEGGE
jgi:uncharacterized protein (DUF427 family)